MLSSCENYKRVAFVVSVWEKLRIFGSVVHDVCHLKCVSKHDNSPCIFWVNKSLDPGVEGIIAICKEWLSPVQQYESGKVTCTYTHLSAQRLMMQENWSVRWETPIRPAARQCTQ
jgi:hypothetical protein